MNNSIVALAIVAAFLVGGVTYLVTNSQSTTQVTTITSVTRTTLGAGGTTYSITTGEYSGCIPPVQCHPTTITASTQVGQIGVIPISSAVIVGGLIIGTGVIFARRMRKS